MWRDAGSARVVARAALRLLRLELQLMTGGRALLILGGQVAWLILWTTLQRFREEPWEPASFYNRTIVVPCLLPALALGASCILAERDDRHLEMSFASAGGRYLVWSFRLAALAVASAVSCTLLAVGTRILVGPEIAPIAAAAHALVPVTLLAATSACLAVLFNRVSSAGLVAAGLVAGGAFLHGAEAGRFDPFLNPFDPPSDLRDPLSWLRLLIANRVIMLVLTGAAVALTLALLQRRERLL